MKDIEKIINKYETVIKKLHEEGFIDPVRKYTLLCPLARLRDYHQTIKKIRTKYPNTKNELSIISTSLPSEESDVEEFKMTIIPDEFTVSKTTLEIISKVNQELKDIVLYYIGSNKLKFKENNTELEYSIEEISKGRTKKMYTTKSHNKTEKDKLTASLVKLYTDLFKQ